MQNKINNLYYGCYILGSSQGLPSLIIFPSIEVMDVPAGSANKGASSCSLLLEEAEHIHVQAMWVFLCMSSCMP